MKKLLLLLSISICFISCKEEKKETIATKVAQPFIWDAANVYFLLTDRFNNGNPENDINFNRTKETAVLRGFKGGDFAGITEKINEGYFSDLGINAIWFSPIVEQIHDATNEGTGNTYGFHGYWTKDWTALEPNFGTEEELHTMVAAAHEKGIRLVVDVVANHTGPATKMDALWPKEWVRTEPNCTYDNYLNTTSCTLVTNLPDILTESESAVNLPDALLQKWEKEGRLETELKELNDFFTRTGYPRAPKYYIVKWLTDYITEYGFDGFRVDTVKHADEDVWSILRTEADYAFNTWKKNNPTKVLDDNDFFMVGEVYNYGISGGQEFDFGDKTVNYFDYGFDALINFELKYDAAEKDFEAIFKKYDSLRSQKLKGETVLNYLTSHDDGGPFDKDRTKTYQAANVLLLTPGMSQVYYGDETARDLTIEGTEGDATLRSFMNWETLAMDTNAKDLLLHYQKLGRFRAQHPAIGAGAHNMLSAIPYAFSRTLTTENTTDKVIVAMELKEPSNTIPVKGTFKDGTILLDTYSGNTTVVKNGMVTIEYAADIVLLEQ